MDDASRRLLYVVGLWAFVPPLLFIALADVLLYGDGTDADVPLGPLEMPLWLLFIMLYPLVLSGLLNVAAIALLAVATHRTRRLPLAVAGGLVAAAGFFGFRENVPHGQVALFAGIALAAAPLRPWLLAAAVPAVLGAFVEEHAEWGRLLRGAGAVLLGVLLVVAGWRDLPHRRRLRDAAA